MSATEWRQRATQRIKFQRGLGRGRWFVRRPRRVRAAGSGTGSGAAGSGACASSSGRWRLMASAHLPSVDQWQAPARLLKSVQESLKSPGLVSSIQFRHEFERKLNSKS